MDEKVKADWVKALRSGEYRQCRGGLYEGDSLCCLGVLWDICGRPEMLNALWAMHVPDAKNTLILMNDSQGKTFPEIADYIEANL